MQKLNSTDRRVKAEAVTHDHVLMPAGNIKPNVNYAVLNAAHEVGHVFGLPDERSGALSHSLQTSIMAQGNGGGLISSAFVSQDEINHIVGTSVTKVGQQLTALDKAASDPHNPSATADRLYAECLRSSSNPIEQPGVGSTETIQQTFNTPANNQSSGSFNTPVTNQPLLTPADQAGPSTK